MAMHCHGVWRAPACSGLAPTLPPPSSVSAAPPPRTPRGAGRAAPGLLVQESSRPRVPAPFWGLSPSCCSSWKGLVSQHLSPGWQGDDIGWLPRSPVPALAFPPQAWPGPPCPLPATSLDPAQTHLPLSPQRLALWVAAGPGVGSRCPAVQGDGVGWPGALARGLRPGWVRLFLPRPVVPPRRLRGPVPLPLCPSAGGAGEAVGGPAAPEH